MSPQPEGMVSMISADHQQLAAHVKREDSALRQNIASKGQNAYYFAHNREFVVPADAKVVSGPGLVTGGAPTLISSPQPEAAVAKTDACSPTEWIKDFSWADGGVSKAKVYVELPKGVLSASDQVKVDFKAEGLECIALNGSTYRCKIEPLTAEIVPEECSYRVNLEKSRVSLTLKKKKDCIWSDLQSKIRSGKD